jgi:hypothetical protein
MQYILLIYADHDALESRSAEEKRETTGAYMAYTSAMQQAGVHLAGARLQSVSSGTTVRIANGKTQVLNGPYAETREQLGGYYLIEAPDLDSALSWASRCPGASYGAIEVRPIWPM